MIKQIKPNSPSHKFLSLIFEAREIRKGINICDVPWRLLSYGLGVCAVVGFVLLIIFVALCMLSVLWKIFFDASWIPVDFIGIGIFCYVMALLGILLHWFESLCAWSFPFKDKPIERSERDEDKEPTSSSLISIWWKSFKEKACVKIVVEEEGK